MKTREGVEFPPNPFIFRVKVPNLLEAGFEFRHDISGVKINHGKVHSWAAACATCLEIMGIKSPETGESISAKKLEEGVLQFLKRTDVPTSSRGVGGQGASPPQVWKFLKDDSVQGFCTIVNYGLVESYDVADIMKKVNERPVVAAMRVGDDFSEWANGDQIGIYEGPVRVPKGDSLKKHNVVIIGFGSDKITERYYWLVVTNRSAIVLKVYMDVVMEKPRDSDVWEYLVFEISYPIPHIKRKRVEEEVI